MRQVSMATRDEVTAVLVQRYAEASRHDRGRILDEMVAITGHHRARHARRRGQSLQPSGAGGGPIRSQW